MELLSSIETNIFTTLNNTYLTLPLYFAERVPCYRAKNPDHRFFKAENS